MLSACGRRDADTNVLADTTPEGIAASAVRAQYRAGDIVAAGAWTWASPDGAVYVLIDAQSTIDGLVQGRAELWATTDSSVQALGRSDVMPAAAEIGAYAFQDLTGDGLPDLFGFVADSAGVSYPVFIPGARGGMTEEIATSAPGWRFSTEDPDTPLLYGASRACALQLRAEEPAPDGQGAGWRYLSLLPGGELGAPQTQAPDCAGG